jgi:hypothetical protein
MALSQLDLPSFILALVLAVPATANAASPKEARSNDVAASYILEDNGDLFRIMRANGAKCQITNDVTSFKISQHPTDRAMIYLERRGDLMILGKDIAVRGSNCPKATTKVLMRAVAKYSVVSSVDTTIVSAGLGKNGTFKAWNDRALALWNPNVREYSHNGNFGQPDRPFSSYVIFARGADGDILKVKGKEPASSKWDAGDYASILEFRERNHIQ